MFYEKFINRISDSHCHSSTISVACENQSLLGERNPETKALQQDVGLEGFYLAMEPYMTMSEISLEEENPFDGIGDEGNMETTSSDTESTPFDDIEDDQDTENPFGDFEEDGGDFFAEEETSSKRKEVTLDRKKSIEEDHDLSTQIRANFSRKFLELEERINTNIGIIDRTVVYHPKVTDLLERLKVDYTKIQQNIQTFGHIVVNKTYEEIFQKYVEIHTQMMRLKQLYQDILQLEK